MHKFDIFSASSDLMQDVITQPWWVIVFITIGILALLLLFIVLICKLCSIIRKIIESKQGTKAPQWPTDLILDFNNDFDFDITDIQNMSNFSPQFETDVGFIYESDGLIYETDEKSHVDTSSKQEPQPQQQQQRTIPSLLISVDTGNNDEVNTENVVVQLQPIKHVRSGGRDAPKSSMNLKNGCVSRLQLTGVCAPPSSTCTTPKPEQMGGLSLLREIEQILADRAIQDLKRESTNLQLQLQAQLGGGNGSTISLFRDASLDTIELLSSGDNDDDDMDSNDDDDDENSSNDSSSSDDGDDVSSISDLGVGAGGDPFTLTKEIETALASMIN